jgi:hypothetical protein
VGLLPIRESSKVSAVQPASHATRCQLAPFRVRHWRAAHPAGRRFHLEHRGHGAPREAAEAAQQAASRKSQKGPVPDRVAAVTDQDLAARYQRLDAAQVVATTTRLRRRVAARFPERGLARVAGELVKVAGQVADSASTARQRLRRIRVASRVLSVLVVVITIVALALTLRDAVISGLEHSFEWIPLIESTVNDIVFAALAVFFLYALPNRIERSYLLRQLHRLRSLAHIVDMHQLTKDPERLRPEFTTTPETVDVHLSTPQAMENYLDYCSEMLSLIGKIAALCAEESQDSVILDTVSTVETLTTGMSRKIWQKISLLPER